MATFRLRTGNDRIRLNRREEDTVVVESASRRDRDIVLRFESQDVIDLSAFGGIDAQELIDNARPRGRRNVILRGEFGRLVLNGITKDQLRPSNFITNDESNILPSLSIDFDNFSNLSNLNLNGSAAQNGNVLRLTPDVGFEGGSAFYSEPFLIDANTSFQTNFQFQITGSDGSLGADGLVFILQNGPEGANTIGEDGGELGYGGVSPSVGIEFDTFSNGELSDPNDNHVGVNQNGSLIPIEAGESAIDLNEGSILNAWIDYDGTTDNLQVFLADTQTKPGTPLLSATIELDNILGSQAYAGFSAATGGLKNNHDIINWEFTSSVSNRTPIAEPGNTLATAFDVDTLSSTPQTFTNSVSSADPADIYRLDLASRSQVGFSISANGSVNARVIVDRNNNGQIDPGETPSNSRGSSINGSTTLNAGTSFIEIFATNSGTTEYTLEIFQDRLTGI